MMFRVLVNDKDSYYSKLELGVFDYETMTILCSGLFHSNKVAVTIIPLTEEELIAEESAKEAE